jgi:hypothetical protein
LEYDPEPPEPDAVKTTLCPTSLGFRFEDIDAETEDSGVILTVFDVTT